MKPKAPFLLREGNLYASTVRSKTYGDYPMIAIIRGGKMEKPLRVPIYTAGAW